MTEAAAAAAPPETPPRRGTPPPWGGATPDPGHPPPATPRRLALLATPALLLASACATRPVGYEPGGAGDLSCVPYARARSGIRLRGDAWEWWHEAAGRYPRSREPRAGAVLVFERTGRLRQGHLAVVARVAGPREIRVDHANWATEGTAARGRVATDQPVRDVSRDNDWSLVRVWYPRIGDFGTTVFPARGFILPGPVVA